MARWLGGRAVPLWLRVGSVAVLAGACVQAPAPSGQGQQKAEEWVFDRMIDVADTRETLEETVVVRHCVQKEEQSVTCEGGVAALASAGTGSGIGGSLTVSPGGVGITGQVESAAMREVGMSHQRSLGRQYALEAPEQKGLMRTYRVVYEFRVLKARAFVRSSYGRRQQLTHPLVVSCSIRADQTKEEACPGMMVDVPSDPPSPTPGGELVDGDGPNPTAPSPPATPDPNWEYATVDAGKKLKIRLSDRLGTDVNRTEDRFEGTLADDLQAGPIKLPKRETTVRGSLALVAPPGRVSGKATLVLRLTALRMGDLELPVTASEVKIERSGSGKDWLRRGVGVALGAGAGAAAGGRRGAAQGAGGGLLVAEGVNLSQRGPQLVLNPGRELEFRLTAPLLVPLRRLQ
jgi:hypothetical protein